MLARDTMDLYTENYKILLREKEEDKNNWAVYGLKGSMLLRCQFFPN